MARRRATADLTEARKAAMVRELESYAEIARQADLDRKIHAARCWDAGMTDEEIAAVYGISRRTAVEWRREGEQERDRRRSVGIGGPSE